MQNWLNLIPIFFILLGSCIIYLGANWRSILIAMAVMVLGLFFLYMQVWDIFMAGAKLITGWMCTAILSFTTVYQVREEEIGITPKRVFKAMSLIMAWMIAYIISSRINDLFGVSLEIAFTSFALIGCGLLQLGSSSQTFKVVLGILMFFFGFEILFADLESSILVNAMILAIDLLVSFVGAYLITIARTGEKE